MLLHNISAISLFLCQVWSSQNDRHKCARHPCPPCIRSWPVLVMPIRYKQQEVRVTVHSKFMRIQPCTVASYTQKCSTQNPSEPSLLVHGDPKGTVGDNFDELATPPFRFLGVCTKGKSSAFTKLHSGCSRKNLRACLAFPSLATSKSACSALRLRCSVLMCCTS